MWCCTLVFLLILALTVPAVGPSLKTDAVCVTPQGTLCRTIRWEASGWANESWGFHAISRWSGSAVMACRADGAIMERYSQRIYRNYFVLDIKYDRGLIRFPVEMRTTEVDHEAEEFSSRSGVPGGFPVWDADNKDCTKTASRFELDGLEQVGEETVSGVRSIKFTGSRSESEYMYLWLAPSLGCTQMRVISKAHNSFGLPTLYSRQEVKSVRLGEPDAELFRPPSSYRRVR